LGRGDEIIPKRPSFFPLSAADLNHAYRISQKLITLHIIFKETGYFTVLNCMKVKILECVFV